MDTSRVFLFYFICYGLCLPKVVSLLGFWSLGVSMCEFTEAIFRLQQQFIITAHHRVFVRSQSQRDKMAEERPQSALIPFLCHLRCCEAFQRWTRVVLIQGFEENSFLLCCTQRFTLPPHPIHLYPFWGVRPRSPAMGLGGERNYNTRFHVNSMYAQKHKHSLSFVTRPCGSNFALWLIMWSRQQM